MKKEGEINLEEKIPEQIKEIEDFYDAVKISECEKLIYEIFKDKNLDAKTASLVLMGCIGNVLNIMAKAKGTKPTEEFNRFWFIMIDSFNKTAERLENMEEKDHE